MCGPDISKEQSAFGSTLSRRERRHSDPRLASVNSRTYEGFRKFATESRRLDGVADARTLQVAKVSHGGVRKTGLCFAGASGSMRLHSDSWCYYLNRDATWTAQLLNHPPSHPVLAPDTDVTAWIYGIRAVHSEGTSGCWRITGQGAFPPSLSPWLGCGRATRDRINQSSSR